ncbi:MAG: hypothetical protein ACRDA8_00030 [Shewanella sp.]
MNTLKLILPAVMLMSLIPSAVYADTNPTNDPAANVELQAEEKIDDGFKKFGYLTGLALGCVDQAQKTQLEREAMDVNSKITRLFGIDRAFLFTAAFGYGSSVELKIEECKTVLENYEARIASFRKGE